MSHEELYDRLADGQDVEIPPRTSGILMRAAREKATSDNIEDRLGALRVASVLSVEYGLPVTEMVVNDVSTEVRRYAFNQAIAARYDGLPLIRRFAEDADETIATEAVHLLVSSVDMQSTPLMRRLLRSPFVAVRVGAATLLGNVAGPSVRPELQRLVRDDPDPQVRATAEEALRRMVGELPRNAPVKWWDGPDDQTEESLPPPPPIQEFTSLIPEPVPQATTPLPAPTSQRLAVPPPVQAELGPPKDLPAAFPAADKKAADPEEADVTWATLPAQLPNEAGALIKLLGMVAPEDRTGIIARLHDLPPGDLASVVSSGASRADPATARGIALAAAGLGRSNWLSTVRRLVFDSDDGVRAAAAEAIGVLSGPSGIPSLTTLLGDQVPRVRARALRALLVLCTNVDRLDIARNWADRLSGDADPHIKALAKKIDADLS